MNRPITACLCFALAAAMGGCAAHKVGDEAPGGIDHYQQMATAIESPTVPAPSDPSLYNVPAPTDLRNPGPVRYWDMSLQEVMQYAMAHARVLQDLGGTLLRTPESVSTTYDVAVVETDPQYGPEAALSAFNAQLSSSLLFQKNLQQFNNQQIGNNGFYEQTFDNFQAQITKQSVTGDQFTLQHTVDWDSDNYLSNQFKGGNWDTLTEAQVRHPFLQGGGVDFNRIAGPGARPGVYNGVLVARMKTDISLADFQIGLRNYVSNLENAYWDLYFAYRDLDTKIKARDDALEIWRNINALHQVNRRGGEADKEAQARAQYFQFEEEVYNALVGRQLQGTQTDNGSTPGTFRPLPGVRTAERRLRALLGLPPTDGRLIRPSDEPPVCCVTFDWAIEPPGNLPARGIAKAALDRQDLRVGIGRQPQLPPAQPRSRGALRPAGIRHRTLEAPAGGQSLRQRLSEHGRQRLSRMAGGAGVLHAAGFS